MLPKRSHERGVILLLWRLFKANRLASVRVFRFDGQPAPSFAHDCENSISTSELLWAHMVFRLFKDSHEGRCLLIVVIRCSSVVESVYFDRLFALLRDEIVVAVKLETSIGGRSKRCTTSSSVITCFCLKVFTHRLRHHH